MHSGMRWIGLVVVLCPALLKADFAFTESTVPTGVFASQAISILPAYPAYPAPTPALAVSFVPTDGDAVLGEVGTIITSVFLPIDCTAMGLPTAPEDDVLSVAIYSNVGGLPGALVAPIATAPFLGADTWDGGVTINCNLPLALTEGSTYWLVVAEPFAATAGSTGPTTYQWYGSSVAASADPYAYVQYLSPGVPSWALHNITGLSPAFSITGIQEPVPEPGSFGLLALAGVAALTWRRRRAA